MPTTTNAHSPPQLTDHEREVYAWQIDVAGFGQDGQRALKGASVLVSRVGGLGGVVAYELAAAGVGRLVLAHAGNVKPSDLNRQLLMAEDWLGRPRLEVARRKLLELNPRLDVVCVPENASATNAHDLVSQADVVVDCAPMFEERLALNAAAVAQRKPIVECAMFDLEATITTVLPGRTPCLACLVPTPPPAWKRRFPVFGAVSGAVACLGAMEAIKLIARFGEPLAGRMLRIDTRTMRTRELAIARDPACAVCGGIES